MNRRLMTALAALGLCTTSVSAQQVMMNFFPPSYWTCDDTAASLPLFAPNSALTTFNNVKEACRSKSDTVSGLAEMVVVTAMAGAIPADHAIVQVYEGAGLLGTTEPTSTQCGDVPKPLRARGVEYFTPASPSIDLQMKAMCCETTLRYDFRAVAAILPLPQGAQPIPPGENAAEAWSTKAEAIALNNQVHASSDRIVWGYTYEYDGCQPNNPRTSCGNTHCLTTWQQH